MSPISRKNILYPINLEEYELPKPPKVELDPFDLELINIGIQLSPDKRYWYYVQKAIPSAAVAPLEPSSIKNIETRLSIRFPETKNVQRVKKEVLNEIYSSYDTAVRQSIVDYILMDPNEQTRLEIPLLHVPYEPQVLRAPVPWHQDFADTKSFIQENLYNTNPIMFQIQRIFAEVSNLKLLDMSVFDSSALPISIEQFLSTLRAQCMAFRTRLLEE